MAVEHFSLASDGPSGPDACVRFVQFIRPQVSISTVRARAIIEKTPTG